MDEMRRVAYGLITGGVIFFLLTFTFVRTLPDSFDATRIFHGFVLLVSGMVTLGAVVVLCILLFQRSTELDDLREPLAGLLVWAITWLLHVLILRPVRA